ncbi:24802_t:CDS:2, partial [Racocetra persica]
ILIYDKNHKKSSNKPIGNEQEPNVIDKKIQDMDESFSQNDNELMPDIQDNNTTKNKQTNDNNECTDENQEMDVSMSVNDNDEPSYNISNQNSDIEQEGSDRNDSDSPEKSEIKSLNESKYMIFKKTSKKRELNHENVRNTKKRKPNASLEILFNFGKEKYVKDVDKLFPTIMIEENDNQIHEIGESATEINSNVRIFN